MAITIIVPYLTFTWIKQLSVMGFYIVLEQQAYERIIFWIAAFGLLISGCAFFNYSAPKQSIRRGIFALLQILLNSLYIWSYKFSGATEIVFSIIVGPSSGSIAINLQNMVMLYMGIYFLTIILKGYDLIDFTVNRDKIRLKRYSKKLDKEEKEK
ncbi:MAG: hypothetical protein ACTSUX_07490 [Promethearchaeota archaeon]